MSRLVHLSDLHFGRTDDQVVEALIVAVRELNPSLVVISGDLTQRAKHREFQAARAFIERLPQPLLVVPGNHDVPLYDVVERFFHPLDRYKRYITEDKMPVYADDHVGVVGVSSARSFTIAGGKLSRTKLELAASRFAAFPRHCMRILVTHHPIDHLAARKDKNVKKQHVTAPELADFGVEIILSGHLHASSSEALCPDQEMEEEEVSALCGMILIGAGTATSTRQRGETNSFNVIEIERPYLDLAHMHWVDETGGFQETSRRRYERLNQRWRPVT